MEIRGIRDVQDIWLDLMERCTKLLETLAQKEYLDSVCNRNSLILYRETLFGLNVSMIAAESYYQQAMHDISDKEEQEVHEKLTFIMQKHFKLYLKNALIPFIQGYIDFMRKEHADNYRVRDLQMDVARKMELIKDYYEQRYDLN